MRVVEAQSPDPRSLTITPISGTSGQIRAFGMGDDGGVSRPSGVDYFRESRYRYVYPPDGEGIFCVGNATECDSLTTDGATRIPWARSPDPEHAEKVRSLHLVPTIAQLRRPALPAFLPTLVNLESLALPTPLVAHLAPGRVREGLTTLVVSHRYAYPVPATPVGPDVIPPGLRALMWVGSLTEPRLPQIIDPLPPLDFLRTNVSNDPDVLRQIRDLSTLRHLELVDLRNVDVFADIRAPLRALEINRTGRNFPVAGLASVATARAVHLNGVRAELDCAVFCALPELVDLTVVNTRKIVNIEALLDCPTLASIRFVNCGNPFKNSRALFTDRGFDHLDIDYS